MIMTFGNENSTVEDHSSSSYSTSSAAALLPPPSTTVTPTNSTDKTALASSKNNNVGISWFVHPLSSSNSSLSSSNPAKALKRSFWQQQSKTQPHHYHQQAQPQNCTMTKHADIRQSIKSTEQPQQSFEKESSLVQSSSQRLQSTNKNDQLVMVLDKLLLATKQLEQANEQIKRLQEQNAHQAQQLTLLLQQQQQQANVNNTRISPNNKENRHPNEEKKRIITYSLLESPSCSSQPELPLGLPEHPYEESAMTEALEKDHEYEQEQDEMFATPNVDTTFDTMCTMDHAYTITDEHGHDFDNDNIDNHTIDSCSSSVSSFHVTGFYRDVWSVDYKKEPLSSSSSTSTSSSVWSNPNTPTESNSSMKSTSMATNQALFLDGTAMTSTSHDEDDLSTPNDSKALHKSQELKTGHWLGFDNATTSNNDDEAKDNNNTSPLEPKQQQHQQVTSNLPLEDVTILREPEKDNDPYIMSTSKPISAAVAAAMLATTPAVVTDAMDDADTIDYNTHTHAKPNHTSSGDENNKQEIVTSSSLLLLLQETRQRAQFYRSQLESCQDLCQTLCMEMERYRQRMHHFQSTHLAMLSTIHSLKQEQEDTMVSKRTLVKASIYSSPIFWMIGGLQVFLYTIIWIWVWMELLQVIGLDDSDDHDDDIDVLVDNDYDEDENDRKEQETLLGKQPQATRTTTKEENGTITNDRPTTTKTTDNLLEMTKNNDDNVSIPKNIIVPLQFSNH